MKILAKIAVGMVALIALLGLYLWGCIERIVIYALED